PGRQCARAQLQREVVGFFLSRKSVDAAVIVDAALNGGDAGDLIVEHNCEAILNMSSRESTETARAILREREVDFPASRRIGIGGFASVPHVLPGDDRRAV